MSASLLTHVMVVMEGQSVRASGRRMALAEPHAFLPPPRYPRPGLVASHGQHGNCPSGGLTFGQRSHHYYHQTRGLPTPAQVRRARHKLNRHGE